MEENQTVHKRRKRYSGKYPKKFEEKYKELNPEKYEGFAEHIKAQGGTPAGTHISIMVNEILDFLKIQPGENGLDCTFGYGGHSSKMLEKLEGKGHLTSLDIDPIESVKSKARINAMGYGDDIFALENINFADIDKAAEKYGEFDFVIADLGVSSMQIDNPERGFSYKTEGPLDLRMNPETGMSAAELLLTLEKPELVDILVTNSDEPYADIIANTILSFRKAGQPIETTTQLKNIIDKALTIAKVHPKEKKDLLKKTCARVFQALRIEVNHEYESLDSLMRKLPEVMNPGGRIAILTFHSGEDRLVKLAFKELSKEGIYSEVARDVIRPSQEECYNNPRAKSTKMRWAIKA